MPDARLAIVTGASGFIGRHTVAAFAGAGWRVRALAGRRVVANLEGAHEVVRVDVTRPDTLPSAVAGADCVVHLAAELGRAPPGRMHQVNVEGTRHLVDAVTQHAPGAKLLLASSVAAGGPAPAGRPRRAEDVPAPITDYGRSKLAAEQVVRRYAGPYLILRLPLVLGAGAVALATLVRLSARGLLLDIAPGRTIAAMHVSDLTRALLAAADTDVAAGAVVALAGPRDCELIDIERSIAAAAGARAVRLPVPARLMRLGAAAADRLLRRRGRHPHRVAESVASLLAHSWAVDREGARRLLAFEATVELDDAVRDMVDELVRGRSARGG